MNSAKLTVNGKDLSGYTVAAELSRAYYREAAEAIKTATRSTLDIVDISEATESSIVLKHIEKVSGEDSFKVYVSGTQLVIECAYDNMLLSAVGELLSYAGGDLKGEVFKKDISVVYYEDFGAVGDGKTDDFKAIYETHKFANECGQTVKAKPDKTYYIFDTRMGTDTACFAEIKTNVDWCGAHFIIDDTRIALAEDNPYRDLARTNIFIVEPNDEHKVFRIDDPEALKKIAEYGINKRSTHIKLGIDWDGPVMIIPYYSGHKVFRRRGYGQFRGEPMHEIIVVEADGRVSEETPIMFDYDGIDYIDVYKLDESTAITIENGVFTTLETKVNHLVKNDDGTYGYIYKGYIARGMLVRRSYTTVKKVEHIIEYGFSLLERAEEEKEGSPYAGMFRASYANCVTFKDCIMPGRIAYGPAVNGHSSYNFGALCVNKIVLDGCVQPNFWISVDPETYEMKNATVYDANATGRAVKTDPDAYAGMGWVTVNGTKKRLCWGIGGTNYCKNMEYLNSTLTRFDAHAGLYHGKVINCNISGMELTGVGDFILEDSNWYPYGTTTPFLFLRADYGYHWDGDISVKNVNGYLYSDSVLYIANHIHSNWYFGYTCAFPNITLDNFALYSAEDGKPLPKGYKVHLFKFKENAKQMHLLDAGNPSVFAVVDDDGDGYIDEPLYDRNRDGIVDERDRVDLDGDGRVGNTSLKYADYCDEETGPVRSGAIHPTCTANLNIVKPPKCIKIVNNGGGHSYAIKDTASEGISDGAWWDEEERYGGFFGDTKFVYGTGENEYFIGTDKNQTKTETFDFVSEYYE